MRNINTNRKGYADVEVRKRDFNPAESDVSDSNEKWDAFQTYYDENTYHSRESAEDNYDAVERGKAFVRGQTILMALNNQANRRIAKHRHEMQAA